MNFWVALFLGLILGWLLEWLIDWLYWRRRMNAASEAAQELRQKVTAAEGRVAEWQTKAREANEECQEMMSSVSSGWSGKVTDLETHVAELETQNAELQARLEELLQVQADNFTRLPDVDNEMALRMRAGGINTYEDLDTADQVQLRAISEVPDESFDLWYSNLKMGLAGLGIGAAGLTAAAIAGKEEKRPDDLTQIKGIGRKLESKLNAAGIVSYVDVATSSPEALEEAVEAEAWQRYDYEAWIVQAAQLAEQPLPALEGDDLTLIEGIGPKYSALLRENGITTYEELANADEVRLANIVQAPGWRNVRYADWKEQARLAALGDDEGLHALQDRLNKREANKLTRIYGLGEKTEAALVADGIDTYDKLAATTPEHLAAIATAAGLRAADLDGWIEEARLRAAGKRVQRQRRIPAGAVLVACPQDLSAVDGIGRVYEQKLYSYGIGTYWELSQMPNEELATVLEARDFQKVDVDRIKASALEWAVKTDSENQVWDGTEPDDLEMLEGVGEQYERRLYNAGICTYEALAELSIERLAEICKAPNMSPSDYNAWLEQARELALAKGASS